MWPLASKPYAVQTAAMLAGADMAKYGYFMEQGLAKTAVDFAVFLYRLQCDLVDAHVVIAPGYLKSGWEDEAAKWKVGIPVITWPDRLTEDQCKKPFIFVINSESMLTSGGQYLYALLTKSGLRISVSLDESSFIKNFSGAISKKTREICGQTTYRGLLCGTPMTQNVMDWYPQLRFLGQINGWNPYQFRNRFAVMGGYMGKVVKGVRNEEELHAILDSCSFRALKKDWWADMPEKIYMPPLGFEMTPKQAKAYQTMLNDFYYEVKEDDGVFANQVVHMKLKLQQISRGFIIDKDNDRVIELMPLKDNPAIKTTKKWIENSPGKVLIAAHYTYSVNMLEEALKDYGFVVMRGGMDKHEMKDLKDRFNEDRSVKGMIGMDAVMARGHTLLGTEDMRCSNTLFFENSYNLEIRSQLEDRNHRWGQDRAVGYYDLFCCSEDKACVVSQQTKQGLVEAIVNAVRRFPKV